MKIVSVVAIAFVALMILPESNAWLAVRCSTFDSYKRDVSNAFSYRDSRINSLYSYVSAVHRKTCDIYTKVKNLSTSTTKVDNFIKSQAYTNSRLYSQLGDLNNKNAALRKELSNLLASFNSINNKNADQDNQIGNLNRHNTGQDSRMNGIDGVNNAQNTELGKLRAVNAAQDGRINDLKSVNSRQDRDISDLVSKDASQDRVISGINAKNAAQDNDISDVRKVDADHESRIRAIVAVNKSQGNLISDAFDKIRQLQVEIPKLVRQLLQEFTDKVNKCVFSDDMLMCMLTPPPRPAYTYTRASSINAAQVLAEAAE